MFYVRYLILLDLIFAAPQLNLYFTDWINGSTNENDTALQHHCLYVPFIIESIKNYAEALVITYCLSELPTKFHVTHENSSSILTFDELSKQGITSEHLYNWSAPIDIIERYQFYLNEFSTKKDLSLGEQIYYNCTLPRFGPSCQYELFYYDEYESFLYKMFDDYYIRYRSESLNLTCYDHLKCNRGPSPSCLDWSEICDGKVDCFDGNFDEEHCWELEINQCKEDEYRCKNGQCIPQSFYQDEDADFDCIDGSNTHRISRKNNYYRCAKGSPTFDCDDITCDSTPLTSSCFANRREIILKSMYSIKDPSVREDCWLALKCLFSIEENCLNYCYEKSCLKIIEDTCQDMFFFPNVPVLFAEIYFAFNKNHGLLYICSNNSHFNPFFNSTTKILYNNTECYLDDQISYSNNWFYLWKDVSNSRMSILYNQLNKYQMNWKYNSTICNRSSMYQCINSSKCISIHRLMNNEYDCPYLDDEQIIEINNSYIIKQLEQTHYKCERSNKYIHKTVIQRKSCDCDYIGYEWCVDEFYNYQYEKNVVFKFICDGFIELKSIENHHDENECQQWECDNKLTHCNHIWNCPTGKDEINCDYRLSSNCSSDDHVCLSLQTNEIICLNNEKINDGQIDCLGAYDEPQICEKSSLKSSTWNNFHCMINQTYERCLNPSELCDTEIICMNGDDERFCKPNRTNFDHVCWNIDSPSISDIEKFVCFNSERSRKMHSKRFMKKNNNNLLTSLSTNSIVKKYERHCLRGIDLYVWSENQRELTCLCPLSYYGSQCQYQNQRISLTIRFRSLSQSYLTLFSIILSLIDDTNEKIIHSFVQLNYMSIRDCENKYEFYFVYSKRPKDLMRNYSIHIDFYEKNQFLTYRGSILFPIEFSFLPVHRLGFLVYIPKRSNRIVSCSKVECIHGKCIEYSNKLKERIFCQCDRGWTGRYCHIQFNCTCSIDSICLGISANQQSICVCPKDKYGTRCLLNETISNNISKCRNGGQWIPDDKYILIDKPVQCICPQGYYGSICQKNSSELILKFHRKILDSDLFLIHIIEGSSSDGFSQSTTFQRIPIQEDSITIYLSQPFHLVYIEFVKNQYYLIVNEDKDVESVRIEKLVSKSDRCLHINELFNKTIVELNSIRRIKYYQIPCEMYSPNLNCFYDDDYLCSCYNFSKKRLADCREFNHSMTFDCFGQNECEHGGLCFQNNNKYSQCPSKSVCMCLPCYYGGRCQFTTSGFGLSLDAILGYQIFPNVNIQNQSIVIKFSLSLTILIILIGLIDGLICIVTFQNRNIREVGCGLYLLISSITTLLTMFVFGLKYFILLFTQIKGTSNELFLLFQCRSIDFFLRICLSMDQWLNACVAVERTMVIIKGPNFSKKKSEKAAKFVIFILFIFISTSYIHDPIYRRLTDENTDDGANDRRIWCIVSYPANVEVYNYIIHIVHFFGPFSINLISSIILIVKATYQQSNLHKKRRRREILKEQLQTHKHLLIAPVVLVILAIPRLIITFVSTCMKSANDAWIFLIRYLISFIPSMINSIVFILPSELYRKQCGKTVLQYVSHIQRRLHLT